MNKHLVIVLVVVALIVLAVYLALPAVMPSAGGGMANIFGLPSGSAAPPQLPE